MARTALTATPLVANGRVGRPTGTAGAADGHYVTGVRSGKFFLDVTVATAETDITIQSGDYPPALSAGQGDLVMACAVGSHFLGPFSTARFARGDGQIWLDYETPANVTVRVMSLPRGV